MAETHYGTTASDEPITEGSAPSIGSGPASVESVRLEPELRVALVERARRDDETPSAVIRKALRAYLNAG